jgi:di/tripeptidase
MKEYENEVQNTVTVKEKENQVCDKWNKKIQDYDNYVKEYLKNYKKSLQKNTVSLSKYPYMKIKSEALNKKLNKAMDNGLLTKTQIKKILKIQLKIVNKCCD